MRSASSPGSMTIASPASSSPRRMQLACKGPTGKVSRTMVSSYSHRFAEGDCVELAALDHFQMNLLHLGRHQINRNFHGRLAVLVKTAGNRNFFIGCLRILLGFIGDEQKAAWFGDANHLPDRLCLVVEKADASHMKDDIEAGVGKGQGFGVAEIKVGLHLPATKVDLAVGQHLG